MTRARAMWSVTAAVVALAGATTGSAQRAAIGREVAIARHLADGDEFTLTLAALIGHGRVLFAANWTDQDGGGRPATKGTGDPLSRAAAPLTGARAFNRVSGPDANGCQGCHNRPNGLQAGAGDFVSNAFVLAQRFDYITFDRKDAQSGSGAVDEGQRAVSLATVGNPRSAPSLLGAGYLEMLARQMTEDLQRTRDGIAAGRSARLVSKGISFGTLSRDADGKWNTRAVQGLPAQSVAVTGAEGKPSLVIRPWHQSGSAVSLREFTNTAYNQHHGIQTAERFGTDADPDGDGVKNEMTRADVTAVTIFLAALPVPGRVIPNDVVVERAVLAGERAFDQVGCTRCHVAELPLERRGWMYSEPGPFNPAGNLRRGEARAVTLDLTDAALPSPRLTPSRENASVIRVPAYTDFKLHDITDPADRGAAEPLDMNQPPGSRAFLAGNRKFLTRRLWGAASHPAHFHHGLFTTLRQAVLAHAGEALAERQAFQRLAADQQDAVIEFLKSLQLLPPGTKARIVDEQYRPKPWPPATLPTY
ncbi:MAG: di-heme oxidoredictase family protein [Vicinamibacterales bacterium]